MLFFENIKFLSEKLHFFLIFEIESDRKSANKLKGKGVLEKQRKRMQHFNLFVVIQMKERKWTDIQTFFIVV